MLKLIGGAIILWGLADFGVSFAGIDLWAKVGVTVPDAIYPYTHYAAFIIGGVLFSVGSKKDEDDEE